MGVFHILQDGSRPADITGRVVRLEDARPLYSLIHTLNEKRQKLKNKNGEVSQND